MDNTNTNEKRKLFVYTIIISALTAASVFLPLFFGIGGYDVIPNKVDIGIFNMLMNSDKTVFTDNYFMICMIIAGWPTLAFGLAAVAIGIAAFIKNDEKQTAVYKKLNLGCLICSLTYSLFGIIDMIVGIPFRNYVLPLNWIYSIPIVVLFIGFTRHHANCTAGTSVAPTKKSKIAILSTLIVSAVIVTLSIGISFGLGYSDGETVVVDGITYKYDRYSNTSITTSGYIVVGAENVNTETLVIPNSINGKNVVAIGEYALAGIPCKEVLLPGSIYEIQGYAFSRCPNLEKVIAQVGIIGNSAFSECMSLETVTTTAGKIGDWAFYGCMNLKNFSGNNVNTIGSSAFNNCTGLASFDFSNNLKSIEYGAFQNSGITSVNLTDTRIETINEYAFAGCDSLTTVDLGASILTISQSAFNHCDNLVSVTIGNQIKEIQQNAFSNCLKLASITYKNYYSSSPSTTTIIILPTSVTDIGDLRGTIYYMGSKEQWEKVNTNNNNSFFIKVYYYSYSDPYEKNPDNTSDAYWRFVGGVPVVWVKAPQETE